MNTNKLFFNIMLIAIVLIIGVPTVYKIIKEHQDVKYIVNEKQIIQAAENCYFKKDCSLNQITLKELYEKEYLKDKIIDPKTKEEYNELSYVIITKEASTFYLK